MKVCSKCGVEKELTEFWKNKQAKSGYNYSCRTCMGAHSRSPKTRAAGRKYARACRQKALDHYGSVCACCGESTYEFLVIDHINGGGTKHRKGIGVKRAGAVIYRWLKQNNYPEGFRVLCQNCNSALGHYKYCPHTKMENIK